MLLHRRKQVEEQYKRALSVIKKGERELEEKIESEKEYREALLHMAAVKQKRAQRCKERELCNDYQKGE